jgi:hypothetical protein
MCQAQRATGTRRAASSGCWLLATGSGDAEDTRGEGEANEVAAMERCPV